MEKYALRALTRGFLKRSRSDLKTRNTVPLNYRLHDSEKVQAWNKFLLSFVSFFTSSLMGGTQIPNRQVTM